MQFAPTPPEEFQAWEVDGIRRTVAAFCRSRRLPVGITEDDLLQEIFLHWHSHRHTYKPDAGAAPRTYLQRLIDRKLTDLWRAWNASSRGSGEMPASLDQPLKEEGEETTLKDVLADPLRDDIDLRLDILRARSRLTPRQLLVLRGLQDEVTVKEIAIRLDLARDTVYEELKRIRAVFTEEGLKDFLP